MSEQNQGPTDRAEREKYVRNLAVRLNAKISDDAPKGLCGFTGGKPNFPRIWELTKEPSEEFAQVSKRFEEGHATAGEVRHAIRTLHNVWLEGMEEYKAVVEKGIQNQAQGRQH